MTAGNAKGFFQLRTTVYLFSIAFQTDLQQRNQDVLVYQNVIRMISQDAIDEPF